MQKEKLTYKLPAQITAWIILSLSLLGALLSAIGAISAWNMNLYSEGVDSSVSAEFRNMSRNACDTYVMVTHDGRTGFLHTLQGKNFTVRITDHTGKTLAESEGYQDAASSAYQYTFLFCVPGKYEEAERGMWPVFLGDLPIGSDASSGEIKQAMRTYETETGKNGGTAYIVFVRINDKFPYYDGYRNTHFAITRLYNLRYTVYAVGALCGVLSLAAFIFLLCGAGHRAGQEEPVPGYLHKVPFDLMSVVCAIACLFPLIFGMDVFSLNTLPRIVVPVLCVLSSALLFTWWCTQFAARLKTGGWWKYTLIDRLWNLLRNLLRGIKTGLAALLKGIPVVWQAALGLLLLYVLEFFGIGLFQRDTDMLFGGWFLSRILIAAFVIYVALTLRKLEQGGRNIAEGILTFHTDTKHMLPVFAKHGNNLNSIAQGMKKAVDEQLKSERMKTELITNVSHDIKTPLTSIINYVDLLQKPHSDAEEKEYLEVLERHTKKLKKLTDDLVEVSKAGSGNMDVHAETHSVNELLNQATGEYSERLEQAGLETVLSLPKEELTAFFDGTLMWRVLDNLFSNVCKYAMRGSRVYIDAVQKESSVRICFKNMSGTPLNISAEELTERFVRGDSARTGEGSGLGLHIAKNLTELMGGSFEIKVDGDLFRVDLTLPNEA